MNRLVRDVQAEPDFNKAAAMAVTRVSMILGVDVCSLYLVDQTAETLNLIANEGLSQEIVGNVKLPLGAGIVGFVAKRAEPVNLADARKHPAFEPIPGIDEDTFKVFLGAPIVHNRRTIGVLTTRREFEKFTEDDEGMLTSLATTLSPLIARAAAIRDLTVSKENIEVLGERCFKGVAGSPGIAIGTAVLTQPPADITLVPDRDADDIQDELKQFDLAVESVRTDLVKIYDSMEEHLDPIDRELFTVYQHILDDEAMGGEVRYEIEVRGQWAQGSIKRVFQRHIDKILQADSEYIAERSEVFRDIAQNLIGKLQDYHTLRRQEFPDDTILVAEEITASMVAEVPADRLKGIVSQSGSANSHTAILAKALDIPAVMGTVDFPLFEAEDTTIILDGSFGEVFTHPSKEALKHYEEFVQQGESFAKELAALRDEPAITRDGHRLRLWVNIGLVDEISRSLDRGAEGIGLFRTEIPFATSSQFPTETQQRDIYREHMIAFEPNPVTMRMLDIGGDKELPYFNINEDNPFLGWRGIRITLDHPDIFLVQVRAMLKANEGLQGQLRIMLPLVTNLEEIAFARNLIDRAYDEITEEGFAVKRPEVGAMIEVPALVYQARLIARTVDFLAVGSNDLTQYMLAVSRTNPKVAKLYQEFHPSVLWALRTLVKDAHAEGKPIGICGEMAGTVEGAILCVGMGYDVLSMNATNIPKVKWVIRNMSLVGCRRILSRVLKMHDADSILDYIHTQMLGLGLDKVIPHREPHEMFL